MNWALRATSFCLVFSLRINFCLLSELGASSGRIWSAWFDLSDNFHLIKKLTFPVSELFNSLSRKSQGVNSEWLGSQPSLAAEEAERAREGERELICIINFWGIAYQFICRWVLTWLMVMVNFADLNITRRFEEKRPFLVLNFSLWRWDEMRWDVGDESSCDLI